MKLPYDQEVTRVAHPLDHVQLELHSGVIFLQRILKCTVCDHRIEDRCLAVFETFENNFARYASAVSQPESAGIGKRGSFRFELFRSSSTSHISAIFSVFVRAVRIFRAEECWVPHLYGRSRTSNIQSGARAL
jgi:hypothetical protein